MIKVIEMNGKLNVVDCQNNLVGFDLNDDCCAHGGYLISPEKYVKNIDEQKGIKEDYFPNHCFDTKFFEEHTNNEENIVIFAFQSSTLYGEAEALPLYLHLFNVHNGYYSKGFKASFDEVKEGRL